MVYLLLIKEFFKNNWKRILIAFSVIGLIYYVYNFYNKHVRSNYSQDSNAPQATISDFQAAQRADTLYSIMSSFWSLNDTEYQTIKDLLNGINRNDYIKISNAFGRKRYDGVSGTEGVDLLIVAFPEINLTGWLREECGTERFQELNLPI